LHRYQSVRRAAYLRQNNAQSGLSRGITRNSWNRIQRPARSVQILTLELLARLAQNVKFGRALKGWTQDDLAREAGLHRNFVSAIERQTQIPSIVTVARIARSLEISVEELVEGVVINRIWNPSCDSH
jgi:ribosome-binding protein aMBF1 (putative translation factor)